MRFLIVMLLSVCAGCGGPQNLVGVETAIPVSSVPELTRHRIYIATPRALSDDPTEFFSGDRASDMSFAAVDVTIPPDHQKGNIERPSSLPADPRKHFVITAPQLFSDGTQFRQEVSRSVRALPRNDHEVLLFVHGYNTNLTSAVLQMAQFVEDSGYKGVPILFTWASSGQTVKYVYDINSALIARDHLVSMFSVMESSNIEGYDLVAHSMGTFLVMEAGRQISMTTGLNPTGKAQNVVLAAPDIDIDLFLTQIRRFPEQYRRFVVLVSQDDKALRASQRVAGGVSRLGQIPAEDLAELGVNAIDLSAVKNTGSLAHSKFKDSPEIAQLIGTALSENSSFESDVSFPVGRKIGTGIDGLLQVVRVGG
ncbi:alpha/beta hydrolase [Ruegeria lacuscaerulensis]|uniref:alpha/beta hydrolase n=1 Tax=Ruegeria lacuscaerulensis TaxID=55218 RepID=UPI00147D7CBD|nr:alpha/beta hydrolase [Ruegeria lacuscaerulensis]